MSTVGSTGLSSGSIALRLMQSATAAGKADKSGLQNAGDSTSRWNTESVQITLSPQAFRQAFGDDVDLGGLPSSGEDLGVRIFPMVPEDKASFKADVLDMLKSSMSYDKAFLAAADAGLVEIRTSDEVPELNLRPIVSVSRSSGGSSFQLKGTNTDLYEQLGQDRNQSYGHVHSTPFYAYWPK